MSLHIGNFFLPIGLISLLDSNQSQNQFKFIFIDSISLDRKKSNKYLFTYLDQTHQSDMDVVNGSLVGIYHRKIPNSK